MLERIKKLLNIKHEDNKGSEEVNVYEKIDNLFDSLSEENIRIQIGEDLIPYRDIVIEVIGTIREEVKDECGFIMQAVNIKNNDVLQENEFVIFVQNECTYRGFVIPTEEGVREEIYDALKDSVYGKMDKIFTYEVTEKYINTVQRNNGWLVWNVTNVLSIAQIKIILSQIIAAGKSISNINYIFEKIGEEVLSDGEYKDFSKHYNPEIIAKNIVREL